MFRAFLEPPELNLNRECVTCTPPEGDPETIFFTDHWKVLLHPSQCGLGNVLLASRRHVPRMADLSTDEWAEFQTVSEALEPSLEQAFGAPLINMQYQRNWAYRTENPDPPLKNGQPNPHIHWHVTPRHPRPVEFMGTVFDDPTFGEPFEWRESQVPLEVRRAIIRQIQVQLPITLI
ncbi:HIT family protein [Deinococcus sp.]|uniref:HIT family protein n=1 Tax=Deinococcus sp. TaxID=47478 RepID=UPI003C7EBDCE